MPAIPQGAWPNFGSSIGSMRIVVVGAGGLVGRALVRAPRREHTVVGLSRSECDVASGADRERILSTLRPDAVVFCAAMTEVDRAGPPSRATNVDAPVEWAARVETWFLSSNFVFDGTGPHRPDATPAPICVYGEQKVEAEYGVLAVGGHVVRVGWVYGPGGRTFASNLETRFATGESVRASFDTVVQPTHADDVAAALWALPRGITHLAGSEDTTWYGMACAVQARVGKGRVVPVRTIELGIGPRPRDARLFPANLPGWRSRLG